MIGSIHADDVLLIEASARRVYEQPMRQFQGQQSMDFVRIVLVPTQMAVYNSLNSGSIDIRSRQRTLVQKHLTNVVAQVVSVPNAEMERLVTPKPDTLQMQGREHVIDARHPLRHTHVIGVFSFKEELEVPVGENAIQPAAASIRSYL